MKSDIEKEINDIITEVVSFNDDEKICNQEARELAIIKLQEAKFWFNKIIN